MNWKLALIPIVAYLLGAIPFGYLLVKRRLGGDIRATGSGNIGAANVARSLGGTWGLLTLALDVAKGVLALWLAQRLSRGDARWEVLAALAVVLGHMFPVFLGFRGGKGVATGLGAFGFLSPKAMLTVLVIWVAVVVIWRYVSLGSILASAAFPVFAYQYDHPPTLAALGLVAGASLIIVRHSPNIQRLVAGTESRFQFRKKP